MNITSRISSTAIGVLAGLWVWVGSAISHPDFDVRPRNIENALGGLLRRDTLVVDNYDGDADLTWNLEVQAEVEGWITAEPAEGNVAPGRATIVVVRQDGRQLDPGHYYANLHFTSNDPTRPEYDVPVAGHTTEFPRIEAFWRNPEDGEWWGIDMDRVVGAMEWGRSYSFNLTIGNRGSAPLDCDTIVCSNGYFTISPGDFNLDANRNRQVQVTLRAVEVGGNAGAITSVSSAWDPRELNFRITATVLPVFRRGGAVPDLTIDEDAAETLVADLDTIFVSSDAGTVINVAAGAGLQTRLARNKELFIRSRPNWNGRAGMILTATLGDSVLADTVEVTVNPVADPPDPFDLIAPYDGDTLYFDGGDSLLVWQSAPDPDLDTVHYTLRVRQSGIVEPVLSVNDLTDSTFALRGLYYQPDLAGEFTWTVTAEGGGLQRSAWSVFTFNLIAGRQSAPSDPLPVEHGLVSVYPNPFNLITAVEVSLQRMAVGDITVMAPDGRVVKLIHSGLIAAGKSRFIWDGAGAASGQYLLVIELDGRRRVHPLILVR